MKLAFVVPRYGPDIRGGAEIGARMLAERLVADRGWEVEVFTTCAFDAITWRDELAEGTQVVRGVTVHRIRSVAGRDGSTASAQGPACRSEISPNSRRRRSC